MPPGQKRRAVRFEASLKVIHAKKVDRKSKSLEKQALPLMPLPKTILLVIYDAAAITN